MTCLVVSRFDVRGLLRILFGMPKRPDENELAQKIVEQATNGDAREPQRADEENEEPDAKQAENVD